MKRYRISKYDPRHRDSTGAYRGEDWTSSSEIGSVVGGRILTARRYMEVESAYVDAVRRLARQSNVTGVVVSELELSIGGELVSTLPLGQEVAERVNSLRDGGLLAADEIDTVVRANLRELIWCKLLGDDGFYVHFGYDFYLYVGGDRVDLPTGLSPELFVEPFDSPYLNDAADIHQE